VSPYGIDDFEHARRPVTLPRLAFLERESATVGAGVATHSEGISEYSD
jgi:hypothetical protein